MSWRDMAACVDTNPGVFFPHADRPRGGVTKKAKARALAVCAGCGVTAPCLTYALTTPASQDYGIWGGTTASQRIKLRQNRALNQHQPLPSGRTLQEAAKM